MKLIVSYFIYLKPQSWESILQEQLDDLIKSGLYDESEKILFSAVGNKKEYETLSNLIQKKYPKIKIEYYSENNEYEFLGIKNLYENSEDNSLNLYFHSKGVTSGVKNEENNKIRRKLSEYTIKNYKTILNEFQKNPDLDISTTFPHLRGFGFYNFFWVRGSYVKKYCIEPKPNINRFFWEEWIGIPHSKKTKVVTFSPIIGYEQITNKDYLYKLRNQYFF
jgi:hypothetical protein